MLTLNHNFFLAVKFWDRNLLKPKTAPVTLGRTYFGLMDYLMVARKNGFSRLKESSEHLLVNSQSLLVTRFESLLNKICCEPEISVYRSSLINLCMQLPALSKLSRRILALKDGMWARWGVTSGHLGLKDESGAFNRVRNERLDATIWFKGPEHFLLFILLKQFKSYHSRQQIAP